MMTSTQRDSMPVVLLDAVMRAVPGASHAVLHDYAVVYAAEADAAGELRPTLIPYRGARSVVQVVWPMTPMARLLAPQRRSAVAMRAVLEDDARGRIDGMTLLPQMLQPLLCDGRPIRVADVPSTGCHYAALPRHAALRWLQRAVKPAADVVGCRRWPMIDMPCRRGTSRELASPAQPAAPNARPARLSALAA